MLSVLGATSWERRFTSRGFATRNSSFSLDMPLHGHYNVSREQDAICESKAQRSKSILLSCGEQTGGE